MKGEIYYFEKPKPGDTKQTVSIAYQVTISRAFEKEGWIMEDKVRRK